MNRLFARILVVAMLVWLSPLRANDESAAPVDGPAATVPARTQIGISPQLFEVSLGQTRATHAYRLHNLGQRDVRVRVRAIHWTLDEEGAMVELPTSDDSIDRWLVVNPLQLDLPAGSSRAVRFSIRPAHPLPTGEYRAALVFEEVPAERSDAASGTISFSTRIRITSAIYASTGEIKRGGEIESLTLSARELLILARGEGSGHARFNARYAISRDGDERVLAEGEVAQVPVLPGLRRPVRTNLPDGVKLTGGRYRVRIDGQLGTSPVQWERVVTIDQAK